MSRMLKELPEQKLHAPLIVYCFHCHTKEIIVNYVFSSSRYSQKNNWGYWTENEEEYKNKWVCDDCLVKLYYNHKWEFHRLIHNKNKQALFRQYLMKGIIDGQAEAVFITNTSISSNGIEKRREELLEGKNTEIAKKKRKKQTI